MHWKPNLVFLSQCIFPRKFLPRRNFGSRFKLYLQTCHKNQTPKLECTSLSKYLAPSLPAAHFFS